jgi:flagellar biosynthesis/type III secretory pathway protein FliH
MRGLAALVPKEAENMPLTIDIHENEFLEEVFQAGRKEGFDEGRREGFEQGLREGRDEGRRVGLAEALLERKIEPVSTAIRHRVEDADMADVTRGTSADQALR